MRFGITFKLFVAFLVTNVVIATAYGIAEHLSFQRSFNEYVRDREQRRLEGLAVAFAGAFAEHGSWAFVRDDPNAWNDLVRSGRPQRAAPGREPGGQPRPSPGPMPMAPAGMRGPPDGRVIGRSGEPGPPPEHPPGGPPPLSLLDTDKALIRGTALKPGGPALSVPIVVSGATVGHMALPYLPVGTSDTAFMQQQWRMSWIIGALAIALATLMSLVFARGLLAPIRRLARGTHRLAAGDFAQRVAPSRRDELGQLIDDFNGLAATLQSMDASRRDFLADVSHELRTPLAVLRGELEALEDGVRSLSPEAIRSLQAEVATLSGLVNDLNDLAIADLGVAACERAPVDLADLIRTALYGFRERFDAARLSIDVSEVPEHLSIVGDARRLRQLVNNVLENSLRYTDAGGRVRIALDRDADLVWLAIEDSAPGVPAELLPRLFERLFRVDASRSRARGGSGLGLALCRSIVQMHQGTIRASASTLGGVRIDVALPAGSTA